MERVGRFVTIERPALRKLKQLDLASRIDDMRAPPGNRHLEIRSRRSVVTAPEIGAFASMTNSGFAFDGTPDMPKTSKLSTITNGECHAENNQTGVTG
jgi:hypothetical protein